jgi:hypothetical protein
MPDGHQPIPSSRLDNRSVSELRVIVGFTAMLLFGISVIIWITMVLIPLMTTAAPTADLGTLAFWTVVTLVVWRLGAGKGWGFAAPAP